MARKDLELRPVMTRIPEGLRRRLEREAERNRRSMNSEIIHRLEQSFLLPEQAEAIAQMVHTAAEASFHGLVEEGIEKLKKAEQLLVERLKRKPGEREGQ
jgi:hypothetical protein